MAEQSGSQHPAEEMLRVWQAWMAAGMEAMQKATSAFTPGPSTFTEWTGGLRDQMVKAVQGALEAARIPTIQDHQRLVQDLGALRSQMDLMRAGLSALEAMMKGQQAMWQAMQEGVKQAAGVQEEVQRTMTSWNAQMEERIGGAVRAMEEWRKGWEDMLRQGVAMGQASQKSLEELTRNMWDISRKVMGQS